MYFAVRNRPNNGWGDKNYFSRLTVSEEYIYSLCNTVYSDMMVKADQEILEMYYTTRWGDELYSVEEYSHKNGIPERVIWMVIARADRLVIEEAKLLDRKDRVR